MDNPVLFIPAIFGIAQQEQDFASLSADSEELHCDTIVMNLRALLAGRGDQMYYTLGTFGSGSTIYTSKCLCRSNSTDPSASTSSSRGLLSNEMRGLKSATNNQKWEDSAQMKPTIEKEKNREHSEKVRIGPLGFTMTQRIRTADINEVTYKCSIRVVQTILWKYDGSAREGILFSNLNYFQSTVSTLLLDQGKYQIFTKKIKIISRNASDANETNRFLAGFSNNTLVLFTFQCVYVSSRKAGQSPLIGQEIISTNSLDFDTLDSPEYHLIISGGVNDLKVMILDQNLKASNQVDATNFTKTILADLKVIDKINMRWHSPDTVDLTISGDSIYFYSYLVSITKDPKLGYKLAVQSREEYLKPISFADAHCDSTKDFIACILYSERAGSYFSVNQKKQVKITSRNSTTLAVWAKKNGEYQGKGYTYRLEDIVPEEASMSLIVGNYSTNQITYMKRVVPTQYANYNWRVKTVNLTNQVYMNFNQTESGIKSAVYKVNLNLTTNNWTDAGRSLFLSPDEYNALYQTKYSNQSNTIALIIGGVFLIGVAFISFKLVKECLKEEGRWMRPPRLPLIS